MDTAPRMPTLLPHETSNGGERLILDPVPEGDWALMVWPTQIEAKKVFVQVLRKIRDNYVHVNEIEMYP